MDSQNTRLTKSTARKDKAERDLEEARINLVDAVGALRIAKDVADDIDGSTVRYLLQSAEILGAVYKSRHAKLKEITEREDMLRLRILTRTTATGGM